jgi:hypothetical protein
MCNMVNMQSNNPGFILATPSERVNTAEMRHKEPGAPQ